MSRPDPLLMLADIARLTFENPDLEEAVVRGIYQHQVMTTGRQPTLRQAREYIGHLTSHLDDATIRVTLGLPPSVTAVRETPAEPTVRTRQPGRGRPRGTGLLTVEAVRAAHRAFRAERGHRPTQEELASALDVAVRSLQRFLKRHDMGWPLGE
jgi:hypothetical protein